MCTFCVMCNVLYPPVAVMSVEGQNYTIPRVTREHMGAYLCIASNGVPPSISKRISLTVECKYTFLQVLHSFSHVFLDFFLHPSACSRAHPHAAQAFFSVPPSCVALPQCAFSLP